MKKIQLILLSVAFTAIIAACGGGQGHEGDNHNHHGSAADSMHMEVHGMGMEHTSAYVCPMHCKSSGSEQPGKCPVCGMDYVKHTDHVKDGHNH